MDTWLYLFFTIAYVFLLIWGIQGLKKHDFTTWTSVVYLVIIALIYDNGIMAIGKGIGEGDTLENLNLARYWSHGLITQLLVLFSVGTLKESGVSWVKKKWVSILAVLYTLAAIVVEFVTEIFGLELEPEKQYGVLRYVSVEEGSGPPVMILLVTLILLVASAVLWKKTKWPVFFIGAVIMTIGSAVPIPVESGAITNAFELVLLFSLIWTKKRLIAKKLHAK